MRVLLLLARFAARLQRQPLKGYSSTLRGRLRERLRLAVGRDGEGEGGGGADLSRGVRGTALQWRPLQGETRLALLRPNSAASLGLRMWSLEEDEEGEGEGCQSLSHIGMQQSPSNAGRRRRIGGGLPY